MSRVAAIILAAGASTRLGEPKQLAVLAGERLLERAIRIATEAGCSPVVVVLGAKSERILAECRLSSARVAVNEIWVEGMASSIRLGIATVIEQADAAIVMTCDQPAVTAAHLKLLMDLAGSEPVASRYAGRQGVPACFPRASFAELERLQGDSGARRLLETARAVVLDGGELDVDTPAALETARSIYGAESGHG